MKQIFNSTIMMILITGTMHSGISDWNISWQKIVPYTAAAAGICFGAWIYKNASHLANQFWRNKLSAQGIAVDAQGNVLLIQANGASIDPKKQEINFYWKEMVGSFKLLQDSSEKDPLITINNLLLKKDSKMFISTSFISTIGIVNPALFYLCVQNQSSLDLWHIIDTERGNLQFKDPQQVQKALDLLEKA